MRAIVAGPLRLVAVTVLLVGLMAPTALAWPCRPSQGPCDPTEHWWWFWCPDDVLYGPDRVCRAAQGGCDIAETCTGSSPACPADAIQPVNTECRAAAGDCDIAETCDGSNKACPEDKKVAPGVTCRASAGPCDVAEACNGGNSCPTNAFASAGIECRASVGSCDSAENCPGNAAACPDDTKQPNSFACRPPAGLCDAPEYCSGGNDCPLPDLKVPAGTVCHDSAGVCDIPEKCDGTNNDCPADAKRPSSFVCRAGTGSCDPAEFCPGNGDDCPVDTRGTVEVCNNVTTGVCDAPDKRCKGDSGCSPDLVRNEGEECRPSAGPCDIAETCTGVDKTCPTDTFRPATTLCRPATGLCDQPEYCTGTSAACPADQFTADTVSCDDGVICNGFSFCDGAGACRAASPQVNGYSCAEATVPSEQLSGCAGTAMCNGGTCFCQVCGNGVIAPSGVEQCDDGNQVVGDGCSFPSCTVEWGWTCTGQGAATNCTTTCGDGQLAAGVEGCDDGNLDDDDGCSGACVVEFGWDCTGQFQSDCQPSNLLEADTFVVAGSTGVGAQNNSALDDDAHGAETLLRLTPGSYVLLRFSLVYLLPRAALLPLSLSRVTLNCFNWTGAADGRNVLPHVTVMVVLANETIAWDENSTSWTNAGAGVVGVARNLPLDAGIMASNLTMSQPLDWTFDAATGDLRAYVGPMLQWLLREQMPDFTLVLTMNQFNYTGSPYLECYSKEWMPPNSTASSSVTTDSDDSDDDAAAGRRSVTARGSTRYVPKQWAPRLSFTADPQLRAGGKKGKANVGVAVGVAIGVGLPLVLCCCLVLLLLVLGAAVVLYFVRERTRVKTRAVMRGEELADVTVSDEILAEDLELLEQLGAGAGGTVFRGRWTQGGSAPVDVAAKRLASTEQSIEEMTAEVEMIRHLRHPHVLRYYGICFKQGDTLLITELMNKGSLDNMLHRDGVRLSLEQLVKYATHAATGLNYLHHQHIIHRDVKPGNLLVNDADTLKIGDFGISRIVDNTKTMTQIGTPIYSAPEVLKGLRYTNKADIYSFGITLIEMWNHERPYQGMLPPQVVMAVIKGTRPDINPGAPPRLVKIIQQCLAPEESDRPSFDKVLEQLHTLQVDLAWERNKSGAAPS